MEYMTIQKNLGHSPRKLRLVADMIRKMRPEQALMILKFTNKAAAPTLAKAITTVLANAAVTGQTGQLAFKTIEVNEGIKMRRSRSAARGRSRPYKKKFSQIKIVLTDDVKLDTKVSKVSKVPDVSKELVNNGKLESVKEKRLKTQKKGDSVQKKAESVQKD